MFLCFHQNLANILSCYYISEINIIKIRGAAVHMTSKSSTFLSISILGVYTISNTFIPTSKPTPITLSKTQFIVIHIHQF